MIPFVHNKLCSIKTMRRLLHNFKNALRTLNQISIKKGLALALAERLRLKIPVVSIKLV
jgi:hypothetical protein